MHSPHHAIISLAVGAAALAVLSLPIGPVPALALALLVGVGIDLDHFVIAWLTTGEWRPLVDVLRDPRLAIVDQHRIFPPGAVSPLQRLLSHALLAGIAVLAAVPIDVALATFLAIVLYAHVLSDLLWDVWREASGDVASEAASSRGEAGAGPR